MYALIKNEKVVAYPYSDAQLRRDNPRRSFSAITDEVRAAHGVHPVHDTPRPEHDPAKQRVIEGTPALKRGKWVQHWNVEDLSAEQVEAAINAARAEMRLSRAQFALSAARAGLISAGEAEAWAGGVALPSLVTDAFAAHIADDMARLAARVDALSASHIHRANPLILLLGAQFGLSDDQLDALFAE